MQKGPASVGPLITDKVLAKTGTLLYLGRMLKKAEESHQELNW